MMAHIYLYIFAVLGSNHSPTNAYGMIDAYKNIKTQIYMLQKYLFKLMTFLKFRQVNVVVISNLHFG